MKEETADLKFFLKRFSKQEFISFLQGKMRIPEEIWKVIEKNEEEFDTFFSEMIDKHELSEEDFGEDNLFALMCELKKMTTKSQIDNFIEKYLLNAMKDRRCFLSKNLRYEYETAIEASFFSAAAGIAGRLTTIKTDILKESNLPSDAIIVVEDDGSGYYIRIESCIPQEYCMIFYEGKNELYRLTVDDQKSDQLVPEDLIKNFTEIKIFPYKR